MTVDEVLQDAYRQIANIILVSATEIPTVCGLVMKKGNWST